MKASSVTPSVARDLQSYTKQKPEMRDFDHVERKIPDESFDHGKTLLTGKKVRAADDDTRSVASEYDYGSKKKFTDVLGNINQRNKRSLDLDFQGPLGPIS
jgi:hypothetical protein